MALNKKFGIHVKESIAPQALKKMNGIVFLEVKLLAERYCKQWKIEYFSKIEGLLIRYTIKDFMGD